jgi:4-amino-4-deoxychorismate lyase
VSSRSLVNGEPIARIDLHDRGYRFGDGVFETLLFDAGRPIWWDAHMRRLQRGCDALQITCPPAELLREEAALLMDVGEDAVLRIQVTRGGSARGYASEACAATRRSLSAHPAPGLRRTDYEAGVRVRWCDTRLAIQPRLAGIKHLNRIEQVLARREWRDDSISEGLMRDTNDEVICATACNLFIVRDGQLLTPALHNCGVAGICREWIAQKSEMREIGVSVADVLAADELFLSSSLRGILPISHLETREWAVGPITRSLQQQLWREHPALAPARGSGE